MTLLRYASLLAVLALSGSCTNDYSQFRFWLAPDAAADSAVSDTGSGGDEQSPPRAEPTVGAAGGNAGPAAPPSDAALADQAAEAEDAATEPEDSEQTQEAGPEPEAGSGEATGTQTTTET